MQLSDFDYDLPKEYIAQRPLADRDRSRLMVVKQTIEHKHFYDLIDFLDKGDVLVLNNSRVVPAKLPARKESGGAAEVLLVRKDVGNRYQCLINGRNIRTGTRLIFSDHCSAKVLDMEEDRSFIEFDAEPDISGIGEMPVPPYIKEPLRDKNEYQTVYALRDGSIAAPTAGFHFTDVLLKRIEDKGVIVAYVTLHISLATFLPVKVNGITNHPMGNERYIIDEKNAQLINQRKGRLFVVGTTSLKALESASDTVGRIIPQDAESQLFIHPGYRFKINTTALITNFHLPKSTLIMLVSAFGCRERILGAYEAAKIEGYRFYSFGDSMILFREKEQPQ
jgi:S-adenosylmethionine:tRNA ribosyltransferase-isomerase